MRESSDKIKTCVQLTLTVLITILTTPNSSVMIYNPISHLLHFNKTTPLQLHSYLNLAFTTTCLVFATRRSSQTTLGSSSFLFSRKWLFYSTYSILSYLVIKKVCVVCLCFDHQKLCKFGFLFIDGRCVINDGK